MPCESATKHGKYVKRAKKAIGSALTGSCKKQFVKSFIVQSICGRAGFELCCSDQQEGEGQQPGREDREVQERRLER